MRRYALVVPVIIALCPALARADAPAAVEQSIPVSNPTAVTLEATATGETEMTFAITSSPVRGSLGQISNPTCQPTGAGGTDCKASVTYTPDVCTSGPDAFTYTATDVATSAASNPATVNLTPGPPPASPPPPPSLLASAATSAGAVFAAMAGNALAGATADYGDGSGPEPLSVDSAGDAALAHTYTAEGEYTLTVTNPGACATSAGTTERVYVVGSGTLELGSAIAPPGGNAAIKLPGAIGLSATLTAAPTDQSAEILGAAYPASSPLFALAAADGQVVAAYDLRAINVSSGDSLVVVFSFPDGGIPTDASLLYFDPPSNRFVPVHPSTLVAHSLVIDAAHQLVSIVFDRSSVPSITELTGTRFALVAAPPKINGLAVTPRCVALRAARSLRLRLTVSEKATLEIRVRRRTAVRAPARCAARSRRAGARAGHTALPLDRRLRPGVYEVTVTARNIHGSSRSTTTFAVAA